jgi:trehalose synthase
MTRQIDPRHHVTLEDYESVAHLASAVRDLRREAETVLPALAGRRVWMLNSTARGGGVAELLPPLIALMNELGVDARWLVMDPREEEFFRLTKHLHNLIHGEGTPELDASSRALYDRISEETASSIREHLSPGDVLVVHDPQPMGAGALLRDSMDIAAIWRCHIGLDQKTPATEAAWDFLCPYSLPYDRAVFTAPEYIPHCFVGRAAIIHPAIDPLSHKNRPLPIHKLVGILANGGLIKPFGPVLTPPFPDLAERFQPDGSWTPAVEKEDMGLLFRPIITQVSRWDRLKGFQPLMEGFVRLKEDLHNGSRMRDRDRRALDAVRLVLAGPEPSSVQDDPEAREVLAGICRTYLDLPPRLQESIAIISLPMKSAKYNALLVNALQRCSDIIVQNSLREGFGLTVTEAMWKQIAVMGSRAVGLRQQIRPGLDGVLIADPDDPATIARALRKLLLDQPKREALSRSAENRVYEDFLVFTHVRRWLELIAETVGARRE